MIYFYSFKSAFIITDLKTLGYKSLLLSYIVGEICGKELFVRTTATTFCFSLCLEWILYIGSSVHWFNQGWSVNPNLGSFKMEESHQRPFLSKREIWWPFCHQINLAHLIEGSCLKFLEKQEFNILIRQMWSHVSRLMEQDITWIMLVMTNMKHG